MVVTKSVETFYKVINLYKLAHGGYSRTYAVVITQMKETLKTKASRTLSKSWDKHNTQLKYVCNHDKQARPSQHTTETSKYPTLIDQLSRH